MTARILAAPTGGGAHALRDRAILELFYSSGLRVSELAGLLLQQVDLVSVSTTLATNAIVEGKGQKTGLLLLPPDDGVTVYRYVVDFAPASGHAPAAPQPARAAATHMSACNAFGLAMITASSRLLSMDR